MTTTQTTIKKIEGEHLKLNEIQATSICANDILSSVLYVSGLVIPIAGIFAPLVLLFIGLVLLVYKGVYREVVEAMPINGGSYNALLNGTSKNVAATAGVLTILSYVATAVISAKSGVDYLFTIIKPFILSSLDSKNLENLIIFGGTIGVLGFFAILTINGVKDSANVAVGIFSFHILTLSIFVILGVVYLFKLGGLEYILSDNSIWHINSQLTYVDILENIKRTTGGQYPIIMLLFLAYSSSLLGVSGFESSANFVEEQANGVFKKTLRNMLIGVSFFNPVIAFLALNITTLPDISKARDFLLADEAQIIGGEIFKYILVIDAFLVLCGAVLTSFVGITGLVKRMALDECLPQFLIKENSKGSSPVIILSFFSLSVSILLITQGNLSSLGGVYAIAFLSVMSMFGLSNIILKTTRPELKKGYTFPSFLVVLAIVSTVVGVFGNVFAKDGKVGDFGNFMYFTVYFIPLFGFVWCYIYRDVIIKFLLKVTHGNGRILTWYSAITKSRYAVFVHKPSHLFNSLNYINQNEAGRNVIIAHCDNEDDPSDDRYKEELSTMVPILQSAGVFPHLKLKLHKCQSQFGPFAINEIAERYDIPINRIFIGSIKNHHDFNYDDLGGVRIIL